MIGKKPIHLLRDEERKKVAEVRDLHIDIGAKDGEQARELVRIGDVAVIDGDPLELPNGRVASRALDNRLGSFVALEAARLVAQAGGAKDWELVAVAAAQEETTFGGSRTSAFSLEPDAAIVVDVTHATDAPGIDVKESGKHELGSGPVLSRGSTLNPASRSCCTRRPSARRSRSPWRRSGATRAPTPTRCTSAAAECPPRSCRSRCATCTRRSSWWSWTTCTRPRH